MRRTLAAAALALLAAAPSSAQDADFAEVADRVAIQDLMMRYARAHDTTNAALYPDIFAPDAQIMTQNGVVIQDGLDAILAGVEADRARFNPDADGDAETYGAMRHLVTNTTIELHGETAAAVSYVQTEVYDDVSRRPEILSVGRYEDELVKRDGRWLIAKRMIILDWGNQELGARMGFVRPSSAGEGQGDPP